MCIFCIPLSYIVTFSALTIMDPHCWILEVFYKLQKGLADSLFLSCSSCSSPTLHCFCRLRAEGSGWKGAQGYPLYGAIRVEGISPNGRMLDMRGSQLLLKRLHCHLPQYSMCGCLLKPLQLWLCDPMDCNSPGSSQPTPVLLPGNSHERRSLVGCSPWGR